MMAEEVDIELGGNDGEIEAKEEVSLSSDEEEEEEGVRNVKKDIALFHFLSGEDDASVFSHLRDEICNVSRVPWIDFYQVFGSAPAQQDLYSRIASNLKLYSGNYLCIFLYAILLASVTNLQWWVWAIFWFPFYCTVKLADMLHDRVKNLRFFGKYLSAERFFRYMSIGEECIAFMLLIYGIYLVYPILTCALIFVAIHAVFADSSKESSALSSPQCIMIGYDNKEVNEQ